MSSMASNSRDSASRTQFKSVVLLGSVFIVAICGLVYELLVGTVSTYLFGTAVTQFSLVIGAFLFAMGIGSFLSQYFDRHLLDRFIQIEILLGLVGGLSASLLYFTFTYLEYYLPVLYGLSLIVGSLIGMEIPVVVRLLKDQLDLKVNVASVLGVDYLGALVASIVFPLLVLPYLGQIGASFLFGLLNVTVAFCCCLMLRSSVHRPSFLLAQSTLIGLGLLLGILFSSSLVSFFQGSLYADTVIYSHQSSYQQIVLTKWRNDIRLYLDGKLQFSSRDEHRYHESLVHPAMGVPGSRKRVLILGGGDGMAAREVLKYDEVEHIDLVDLDPALTNLFSTHSALKQLNHDSLNDPRVQVINQDAMKYLQEFVKQSSSPPYDRVIIDLPDPADERMARLYSLEFYRLVTKALSGSGVFSLQATSPFIARKTFWCIKHTLNEVNNELQRKTPLRTQAYRTHIPSFGEWGFFLASSRPIKLNQIQLPRKTSFLNRSVLPSLFEFPQDVQPVETEINSLNNPVISRYYQRGWNHYNER